MEPLVWIPFAFAGICFLIFIIRVVTNPDSLDEKLPEPEKETVTVVKEKKSNTYWIDQHLHADDERKERHKQNQTPW